MKAISLCQPWASLMALGAKKIETRSWATNYRGQLLIHASKKVVPWKSEISEEVCKALGGTMTFYGCLLCVVDLIDCQRVTFFFNVPPKPELLFGDYTPGGFMWITENPRPFDPPLLYRGQQGLFDVPDSRIPISK